MSYTKRALSSLAALTLLATMLLAVPVSATDSAMDRLEAVRSAAALMDEDGAKAVEELDKALEAQLWADGNTLTEDGKKAFDKMKKAAKKLNEAGAASLVDELVAIAGDLATAEMATATAAGVSADRLGKAAEKMDKAAAAIAEGKPDKAIKESLKAWKEAAKSMKSDNGGGSGGKYAAYEVEFVYAPTMNTTTPTFITVSGSNEFGTTGYTGQGNEGYIFSRSFTAVDSFHGASLTDGFMQGMQLHVSCSDAFPGGYGAKSDPSGDANWLINTINIVKYDNGVVDKSCELDGAGLDVPVTTGGGDGDGDG